MDRKVSRTGRNETEATPTAMLVLGRERGFPLEAGMRVAHTVHLTAELGRCGCFDGAVSKWWSREVGRRTNLQRASSASSTSLYLNLQAAVQC